MSRPSIPASVLRAAVRQARTTLVRKYSTPSGLGNLFVPLVILVVLFWVRDADFSDGLVTAGGYVFAGFLGFGVVAAAIMGVAGELQTEREDGTLLRAKAVPHGMTGHLLSKLLVTPVDALIPVVPAVVGAALLLPEGTMPTGVGRWALLFVVFLLTVAAMMPWGAVLGAVFRSMMGFAWAMIGIYVLAAVSGLFFPATLMPAWAQWLVQATPLYWIGRAFRAVLLPEASGAVEIGGSWNVGLTLVVLLAWAVVGLLVAPVLLRRMARRQSGSLVAAARERVMQRGY
ncbi:ABC transporter permease [Ornithinimicrobium pekingense]|uniref:Transport permease protein n=1 Tax=Ornithinimicrobium pekingense TaxID=384677 RepID=A0ABQ2F973_9MICO|nr:ABC transporter permease [Ornithinimicrobium pekingense]GGK73825.1 transport permease protein [Ornithinimicrobium pekingense]